MSITTVEKDRLVSELSAIRKAKLAAIEAVSYSTGGSSVARQSLDMLVKEEKRLEDKLKLCGYDSQGNAIKKRNRSVQVIPYD